jgi:monoterpene epsilon-lactone hydrolase
MKIEQLHDRIVLTGHEQDRARFREIVGQARSLAIYTGSMDVRRLRESALAFADSPLARPPPADLVMTPADANGVSAWWFGSPAATRNAPILYFHGGGYVCGSVQGARGVVSSLVRAFGAPVLAVAYRQSPEQRFPAAVDDARASYAWLVKHSSEPITIIGESAGGALAVSTALHAARCGLRPARAVIATSAWFDIAMTGASWFFNRDKDLIARETGLFFRDCYLAGVDPKDSAVSPLNEDLGDAPPLLIQTGSHELALDDAQALVEKARHAGVRVQLEVYNEMPHGFVKFANPIGDTAIRRMVEWESRIDAAASCATSEPSSRSSS